MSDLKGSRPYYSDFTLIFKDLTSDLKVFNLYFRDYTGILGIAGISGLISGCISGILDSNFRIFVHRISYVVGPWFRLG